MSSGIDVKSRAIIWLFMKQIRVSPRPSTVGRSKRDRIRPQRHAECPKKEGLQFYEHGFRPQLVSR
jgi:hypothetical protein